MLPFLVLGVVSWPIIWYLILVKRYRHEWESAWKEPVLRRPVLIIESDDWGAGPLEQASALSAITDLLSRYQDNQGRHPVMTLGLIFGIPDTEKIKASDFNTYHRLSLDEKDFAPIRKAITQGVEQNVFSLQLHGMEHFWPPSLLAAVNHQSELQALLEDQQWLMTEQLPSHLQSRWVDASELPSRTLSNEVIVSAVSEEVEAFQATFGFQPTVVVPPTFVWNDSVERAWFEAGLKRIVTPGFRCIGRNEQGGTISDQCILSNGQHHSSGLQTIVRDAYFEPSLGHSAESALEHLKTHSRLAKPTLLETHRFNFIQSQEELDGALEALDQVLIQALREYPNLMFISTDQLGQALDDSGEFDLLETRWSAIVYIRAARIWAIQSARKWLYLSGLFIPLLFLLFGFSRMKK